MGDAKTVWVGNLSNQITEELLYELFLQAGPVERVKIPTDREGRQQNYGFVTFKHEPSVPYTTQLFQGVRLFDKTLNIQPRNGGPQRDKQDMSLHQVQRSFSYPADVSNAFRPNEHTRYDQQGAKEPYHSIDDLAKMGKAINMNHNYQESSNDYDHGTNHRFQGEKHFNRHTSWQGGKSKRDYNHSRFENAHDNDRHNDYGNNRNHRNNSNKRNFGRNNGRRNQRNY
ncbi:RNA-binding protein 7 [Euwallacea similis]|uniref:RNA-binding protein 7 n=1 Tax=Euwallacea similis TaxID=1736056 RepID=UPI0034505729